MKMSDVFELPVRVTSFSGAVYYGDSNRPAYFDHIKQADAACLAINTHDHLTDLNEELLDLLREVIALNKLGGSQYGLVNPLYSRIEEVLTEYGGDDETPLAVQ